jgi:hypothetical protein
MYVLHLRNKELAACYKHSSGKKFVILRNKKPGEPGAPLLEKLANSIYKSDIEKLACNQVNTKCDTRDILLVMSSPFFFLQKV